MFQLFALYPHLTAFENIAFPLRATGETRAEVERKVREVAASLRIEQLLGKRPSQLSGGDMQRVAIGRALVRRPKALLMDEPIGALDAKLREDMRAELKRLHIENGTTSVYVTHDQVEAMSLADRIAVMNDGVLQQVGSPSEVYLQPGQPVRRAVRRLAGDEHRAGGGRAAARPRHRSASAAGRRSTFPAELRGRLDAALPAGHELVMGVRPEAVLVARDEAPGLRPLEAHFIEPLGAYDIVDLKVGEQLPEGAHGQRLRAQAAATGSGRGSTRAQVHFFDATSGDSLDIRLGPWLRSGSTASPSASAP